MAIGGLLLILLDRRLPPRSVAVVSASLTGLAWLAWLLLRLQPGGELYLWLWSPPLSLPADLQFQLLGWSWLAGLCVIMVAFVALCLPGWRRRPGFSSERAWALLLTALTLLVLLAGNWLTLLGLWVGMVLLAGLVAGSAGGASIRVWSYGLLGSLFLFAAPLFNGGRSLESSLTNLTLNAQAQFLVILAAAITLAAYPFHLWLIPPGQSASGDDVGAPAPGQQLAMHLVPGLAALHLLALFSLPLLASQAWAPLVTVALLGSALAAWAEQDERRAWVFVLVNRCTWALLVVGLTQAATPEGAMFALLCLGLGALLWVVGGVVRQRFGWSWPLWLGIAVFYGLPLTPGFVPNLQLASLAGAWVAVPGWLVLLLAQSLVVAALMLRPVFTPSARSSADASSRLLLAAFTLSAGFVLWYALAPQALASLVGAPLQDAAGGLLSQLATPTPVQWITLLLPLVLGVLVARNDARWFGAWRGGQRNAAFLAGLDWLAAGAGRLSHLLRVGLSFVADLVDGAGQFGWVILAALLAWLLLRV